MWGCVDGLTHGDSVYTALCDMLNGSGALRCILAETDSRSGSPDHATQWISAPLCDKARVDASLHYLLQLHPISMSSEQARTFHGHSAKRFNLNCMLASDEFDSLDQTQLGRFTGSTAQASDLEPVEALLQAHTISCAVLPDIYADKAHVQKALDLVVRLDVALRRAADLIRSRPELSDTMGGWGSEGAIALSAIPRDSHHHTTHPHLALL